MITKIILPQLSLTMQTGIVLEWYKSVGDAVAKGEPVCSIEGDKATVDVEAPASGFLKKIVAKEGDEFPVKQAMAYIGDADDVVANETEVEITSPDAAQKTTMDSRKEPGPKKSGGRIKASPVAKRLAKENEIDLSMVSGTGPDGLIGKTEVLAFIKNKPETSSKEPPGEIVRDLSGIEKIIAERMTQSNREIPHFHLSISFDLGQANKLRKKANKKNAQGQQFTLTDLMIWSASRAIKNHMILNSSLEGDSVKIHYTINIGLAVNTPKGLLVVVIKDTYNRSLSEIAEVREDLTEKARSGKQTLEDLSGGTFTITNLGMYGIESFDPIIIPGQVGILGIGALKDTFKPGKKGEIGSFEEITITLGCDHRVVSGVAGAEFLSSIKDILLDPGVIFKSQ
jgi:pyruvate dehydrogenase E2 component (dihydrolipoamide acetyltransferase)